MSTLGLHFDQDNQRILDALDVVHIDEQNMIRFMQTFIRIGSKVSQVFISDIKAIGPTKVTKSDVTLPDLLTWGTKFFDAIAWLSLPINKRPNLIDESTYPKELKSTPITTMRGLYFIYFILMTRGTYIPDGPIVNNSQVPRFLPTIMKYTGMVGEQYNAVASFNPIKIGTGWVRHIILPELGTETKQRFALQFPGYRLFQPFKFVKPDKELSDEIANAVRVIKRFLSRGYFWEIHSATRSATVLSLLGPLNANLANLMIQCYSTEKLREMVEKKLLAVMPVEQYGRNDYLNWTDDMFDTITDNILPWQVADEPPQAGLPLPAGPAPAP